MSFQIDRSIVCSRFLNSRNGFAITLKPLYEKYGAKKVMMTSMQAISGGGRSPGVSAMQINDNIIPYIAKEEAKVRIETRKILGKN